MAEPSNLVAWLTKILAEDKAVAETAAKVNGSAEWTSPDVADYVYTVTDGNPYPVACGAYDFMVGGTKRFIARHDPAAVLADIEAKRAIIANCLTWIGGEPLNAWYDGGRPQDLADETLRLLASAYADRPGYLDEWKPTP